MKTMKDVRHSQSQPSLHGGLSRGEVPFGGQRRRRPHTDMATSDPLPVGLPRPGHKRLDGGGKGLPMEKDLNKALKELKSIKSNYKAMAQSAEPVGVDDDETLRRRLLTLSRQAEDGLLRQTNLGDETDGASSKAKLEVAETVMRKLYHRNMELERMVGDRNTQHPANASVDQALSDAFDNLRTQTTKQGRVIHDQEKQIQQLQTELRNAHQQISTLEAAISRQMNSNLQKQLKQSQEDLSRKKDEVESLREEFESLVERRIDTLNEISTPGSTDQAQTILQTMNQRMKRESLEREADVVIWNQRLYELEREAQQLFAERKILELQQQVISKR